MSERADTVEVFLVGDGEVGERIDSFISRVSSAMAEDGEGVPLSRSAAARLCDSGRVLVLGRAVKKNYILRQGDEVSVMRPPAVPYDVAAEEIALDIVYEDGDIIVINKPTGMVVHPAPGNERGTLVSALMFHCGESLSGIGGVCRPGIVHRIDKDTSGLLVVAKNDTAHISLSKQIAEHTAHRTYLALTLGVPKDEVGEIDLPIGRHPVDRKRMAVLRPGEGHSRNALTHYRLREIFMGVALVECVLETGRTHQIRVHLSHIGHPVLGDPIYGGDRARVAKLHSKYISGQCLHAYKLELDHPTSGERMVFEAPLPSNMEKLIEIFRQERDKNA